MGASSTSFYNLNPKEKPIDLDLNLWNEQYQYRKKNNQNVSLEEQRQKGLIDLRKFYVKADCYSCQKGEYVSVSHNKRNSIQSQIEFYRWRKYQNQLPLAKVYGVRCQQVQTNIFCSNMQVFRVMVEKMEYRLHDFEENDQLEIGEIIYMLSECLIGYCYLYKRFGLFEIEEDQIGINTEGMVKVWANSQFAQNHPANQKPTLKMTKILYAQNENPTHQAQTKMIKQLLQIFKTKFPQINNDLILDLENASARGFEYTFSRLQQYSNRNQIFIPNHLQLNSFITQQQTRQKYLNSDQQIREIKKITSKTFPKPLQQRLKQLLSIIKISRYEEQKSIKNIETNNNTRVNTQGDTRLNTLENVNNIHQEHNELYLIREEEVSQMNNSINDTKNSFWTGATGVSRRTNTDRFMETNQKSKSAFYQPPMTSYKQRPNIKFHYEDNRGYSDCKYMSGIQLIQTVYPSNHERTYLQSQILKNKNYDMEQVMSVDSKYVLRGPSQNFQ